MTGSGRIGVCSWSLRPANAVDLALAVREAGLDAIQLALDPVRMDAMPLNPVRDALDHAGIDVLSGMMAMEGEDYTTLESIRRTGGLVPDDTWPGNLEAARANARLARTLGLSLVTFHAGFVPHDDADGKRAILVERLRVIATAFAGEGITIALETGQESAETMRTLIDQLTDVRVGVNFDPANMILYGTGDPVAALRLLAPHVRQVHIKDAVATRAPGEWGAETPVGEGEVDWPAFFAVLAAHVVPADLIIERESGERRVTDVRAAKALVLREHR
ncbi:MAG: sugar phosphate isomerase/epimerase [Gemmatimonadetes bacterium]|nr:sugar phosphate isomerase/epimerase [Gemmatimonadota bacterium]